MEAYSWCGAFRHLHALLVVQPCLTIATLSTQQDKLLSSLEGLGVLQHNSILLLRVVQVPTIVPFHSSYLPFIGSSQEDHDRLRLALPLPNA